ncbi:DUF5610 domain-containing protein [Glaciecola sp. 1036]|uniref:DUF5610 domain-containing protein n=1 Tax=Alteromonadaceae TaxID=72275 RepID=UPI003CFC106A
MNTVEANIVASAKPAEAHKTLIAEHHRIRDLAAFSSVSVDVYTGTSANDAVMSRAFSSAVDATFKSVASKFPPLNSVSHKEKAFSSTRTFDSTSVQANIFGFVKASFTSFAAKGSTASELETLRTQAIEGVEIGFSRALEDMGIDEKSELFGNLQNTAQQISEKIKALSVSPEDYLRKNAEESQYNQVDIRTRDEQKLSLDFNNSAVFIEEADGGEINKFTTKSSNISFAIDSENGDPSKFKMVAEFVNKADDLLNQFYRDDVEVALQRIMKQGISITDLDKFKVVESDTPRKIGAYSQISMIGKGLDNQLQSDIKLVKKYDKDLSTLVKSAQELFASQNESTQIINGLVNQLKDVQVPDLLHAINRFHRFNEQFR